MSDTDKPPVATEPAGARLLAVRLANALGKPFGLVPFPRAFPNASVGDAERGRVFDQIYRENFWGSGESRSGLGSERGYASAFATRLQDCLTELHARRLFDAPCGDLNWVLPIAQGPTVRYSGGDISASLVAELKRREPELELRQFDICEDSFPDADVWLCRDCLFHLPFADIRRAFENFARSTIPFALLTTHRARMLTNLDVSAGGFRYLDLERAPICLPRAERYLKDFRPGRDFPRYVGLWRRETIAAAVARWPGGPSHHPRGTSGRKAAPDTGDSPPAIDQPLQQQR